MPGAVKKIKKADIHKIFEIIKKVIKCHKGSTFNSILKDLNSINPQINKNELRNTLKSMIKQKLIKEIKYMTYKLTVKGVKFLEEFYFNSSQKGKDKDIEKEEKKLLLHKKSKDNENKKVDLKIVGVGIPLHKIKALEKGSISTGKTNIKSRSLKKSKAKVIGKAIPKVKKTIRKRKLNYKLKLGPRKARVQKK